MTAPPAQLCHNCGYTLPASASTTCSECGSVPDARWTDWRKAAVLAERVPVFSAITRLCMPLRTAIAFFAISSCLAFAIARLPGRLWPALLAAVCLGHIIQAWAMAAPIALLRSRFADEFPKRLVIALLPMVVYPAALTLVLAAIGPVHPFVLAGLALLAAIARSQHQTVLYSAGDLYIQAGLTRYIESAERSRSTIKGLLLSALVVFAVPTPMVLHAQIGFGLSIILIWDLVDSRIANYNHEYLWLGSRPDENAPQPKP